MTPTPVDVPPDVSSELVAEIRELARWWGDELSEKHAATLTKAAARISSLEAVVEEVRRFRWKSADKDNMEFSTTVTYSQRDRLRTLLDKIGSS